MSTLEEFAPPNSSIDNEMGEERTEAPGVMQASHLQMILEMK
jgi:hypothetical protein